MLIFVELLNIDQIYIFAHVVICCTLLAKFVGSCTFLSSLERSLLLRKLLELLVAIASFHLDLKFVVLDPDVPSLLGKEKVGGSPRCVHRIRVRITARFSHFTHSHNALPGLMLDLEHLFFVMDNLLVMLHLRIGQVLLIMQLEHHFIGLVFFIEPVVVLPPHSLSCSLIPSLLPTYIVSSKCEHVPHLLAIS